jgi:hypothetical protein
MSTQDKKVPVPPAPASVADTGLSPDSLAQLFMKLLYTGEATGVEVAERMRLPFAVVAPLVEGMRAERLIEVRGTAGSVASGLASYRYALTDLGRERTKQYLDANQYAGPAPVPLEQYVKQVLAVASSRGYIERDRLRTGFTHLIVEDEVLEQVGPAVNAGRAVFLYGPPGNGKTVIAEGMGRALGGELYVPHAIDVDGQIVTFFDPVNHVSLEEEAAETSVVSGPPRDRRWVRIKRPVVTVGGELTLEMLDLAFNPISKFHETPIHVKANGGVFLVDDFGRQRIRPQELLNRWIVPLESRVDYLTLHTGRKFQVPFDVLIVFATNLDPASLADEAFLRRIPYKIPIVDPTVEQFTRIFELNCERRNLRFHQVMVAYLLRRHYAPLNRPLRACQPRDLLDQVTALSRYRGHEPAVTRELIDAACRAYFVDDDQAAPAPEPPPVAGTPHHRMEIH